MKIPLPQFTVLDDVKAHPYPFQISIQALEFLQAALFHTIISDVASGEFIKHEGSIDVIRHICNDNGIGKDIFEEGFKKLYKYQSIFENTSFNNTVVNIQSHWDWFIRNLGKFVVFAKNYVQEPKMNHIELKNFNRIGFNPILVQIELLRKASGVEAKINDDDLKNLKEMSLVRNIVLHNRCEVDEYYIKNSESGIYELGDLRIVDVKDILMWRASVGNTIRILSKDIAVKYFNATSYTSVVAI